MQPKEALKVYDVSREDGSEIEQLKLVIDIANFVVGMSEDKEFDKREYLAENNRGVGEKINYDQLLEKIRLDLWRVGERMEDTPVRFIMGEFAAALCSLQQVTHGAEFKEDAKREARVMRILSELLFEKEEVEVDKRNDHFWTISSMGYMFIRAYTETGWIKSKEMTAEGLTEEQYEAATWFNRWLLSMGEMEKYRDVKEMIVDNINEISQWPDERQQEALKMTEIIFEPQA